MDKIVITGARLPAFALGLVLSENYQVEIIVYENYGSLPVFYYPDLFKQGLDKDNLFRSDELEFIDRFITSSTAVCPGIKSQEIDFAGECVEDLSGDECRDLEPALSGFCSYGMKVKDFSSIEQQMLVEFLQKQIQKLEIEVQYLSVFSPAKVQCLNIVRNSGESLEKITVDSLPEFRENNQSLQKIVYTTVDLPASFKNLKPVISENLDLIPFSDDRLLIVKRIEKKDQYEVTAGNILGLLHAGYELCPFIYEREFEPPETFMAPRQTVISEIDYRGEKILNVVPDYQQGIWMLPAIVKSCKKWLAKY